MPRHGVAIRRSTLGLAASGLSDSEISRRTGISRKTIRAWRKDPEALGKAAREGDPAWRPPDEPAYCYLLGLYLGDGCITVRRNHAWIAITLDSSYPGIIGRAEDALASSFPESRVRSYADAAHGRTNVCLTNPSLVFAFPQHGPGRKHQREIELVPWQSRLTRAYPERLLRGLIHSDGARCVNRFETVLPSGRVATYEYPRYFFTNYSADIRRIFCDHCDLLGLRWTQSNWRNISIAHRDSVAVLDSCIGPKR